MQLTASELSGALQVGGLGVGSSRPTDQLQSAILAMLRREIEKIRNKHGAAKDYGDVAT